MGRACDLVLRPDGVDVTSAGGALALPWADVGVSGSWSLQAWATTRGGDPVGAAIVTGAPGARALRQTVGFGPLARLVADPTAIQLPLLRASVLLPGWAGELARLQALIRVLAARPSWRERLTDPHRVRALVRDIGRSRANRVLLPMGIRQRTLEITLAMQAAGAEHPLSGRPVPGDVRRGQAEVVADVLRALRANRWVDDASIDEAEVVRRVRSEYLQVEPWPFAALAD